MMDENTNCCEPIDSCNNLFIIIQHFYIILSIYHNSYIFQTQLDFLVYEGTVKNNLER